MNPRATLSGLVDMWVSLVNISFFLSRSSSSTLSNGYDRLPLASPGDVGWSVTVQAGTSVDSGRREEADGTSGKA